MSCRIWTNSIVMPGVSFSNRSRLSAMISLTSRDRWLRGLSRTRMSPRFCCVANIPISAPVRRVNPVISGVSLRIFSTPRNIRSDSWSDVPCGVQ